MKTNRLFYLVLVWYTRQRAIVAASHERAKARLRIRGQIREIAA